MLYIEKITKDCTTVKKNQCQFRYLLITAVSILTILGFSNVNASIYRCEKADVVEFSQFPCGKGAKKIAVKEQNPSLSSTVGRHTEADNSQIESYIRIKQLAQKVRQHQDKVDTLTANMNKEISQLKNQSDAQLNNLSGAKKETAIANQMVNVSQRYDLQIEREQREIDRLQKEKLHLQSASQSEVNVEQTKQSKEIDLYIRQQAIRREIAERKSKIDTYQAQMNQQISALEAEASEQPNNLADAAFDNSLSRKMTAVTAKFNTLIEIEQRQIDRLDNEMEQLQ